MIKLVVFDIDGCLTDGYVQVDEEGKQYKRYQLTEIDYLSQFKRDGFRIGVITGEKTLIVDEFRKLADWDCFFAGEKKKDEALKKMCLLLGIDISEAAFIGDGLYDIQALSLAGRSFCPANAIELVKETAQTVLNKPGGGGCVAEMYGIIRKENMIESKGTRY